MGFHSFGIACYDEVNYSQLLHVNFKTVIKRTTNSSVKISRIHTDLILNIFLFLSYEKKKPNFYLLVLSSPTSCHILLQFLLNKYNISEMASTS